jgi:hypothetical protein
MHKTPGRNHVEKRALMDSAEAQMLHTNTRQRLPLCNLSATQEVGLALTLLDAY